MLFRFSFLMQLFKLIISNSNINYSISVSSNTYFCQYYIVNLNLSQIKQDKTQKGVSLTNNGDQWFVP